MLQPKGLPHSQVLKGAGHSVALNCTHTNLLLDVKMTICNKHLEKKCFEPWNEATFNLYFYFYPFWDLRIRALSQRVFIDLPSSTSLEEKFLLGLSKVISDVFLKMLLLTPFKYYLDTFFKFLKSESNVFM